ncbi:putative transcriptional regulator [Selenomonas ruminantium]|uniref:Putative transcriptional regulator n=2 Tax=Selenomonas ruminantium TaxID=971 RepID=A0A1K1N636_SELRU|nr:putative transcriptional regulator [Selenomonas ruminantium]
MVNKMAELITRIQELRRARKMSQSELAEAVGIRRETLSHLENGKYNPSLRLAMDIAKVFGLQVEDVFQFAEDED